MLLFTIIPLCLFSSVFYVFYEQYLTMWQVCTVHLILSLAMVTFVVWTLTNFNKSSALILLLVNTMITVDLLAFMYYWEISLNAVSLVNIVMVSLATHKIVNLL